MLISPDELASLEDALDLLSDPTAMQKPAEPRLADEAGAVVTGEELRDRYLER